MRRVKQQIDIYQIMDILISGLFFVNVFLASSRFVSVLEKRLNKSLCGFSCKFLGGLKKYKSERAIQNSDRRVLRRQQASAEIQSLFICFLKEQVSPYKVYFSLVVNNRSVTVRNLLDGFDIRAVTNDPINLLIIF